ncbi:MAG: hypothetical protein KGL72_04275 [Actinomycetales bacterium]|nr:hypothetical protein [Actinomycetales bacterium]
MAIYAVQYNYSEAPEILDGIRAEHRAFLRTLAEEGILIASGPLVDRNAALLIFKAESLESLAGLLDTDPFEIAGFIGERVIEQWNPIIGMLSEV